MRIQKYFIPLLIQIYLTFNAHAQNWQQVWADEFNGAAINRANWTFDLGAGGWGNNELENYTSRSANATLHNGQLLIIARKENYEGAVYTSARLKTQGLQNWTYGKIEARVKLPTGQGIWPAFWMLGSNITQVSWPACGEIDIMEHINNEPDIEGTIHWNNDGHAFYGGKTAFNPAIYHLYSIEWDEQSIRWLLDGNQYNEANIAANINSTEEFHKPFFILLNVAVGGNWPQAPDATTSFPDTMYVDYVRVYQDQPTGVIASSNRNSVFQIITDGNEVSILSPSMITTTQLFVMDLMGRKVESIQHQKHYGSNKVTIDMSHLQEGLYLITGTINDLPITKRIIKQ